MNDVKLAWDTIIGDDDEGSQIVANATDAEAALTWNDLFGISCSKLKCILQNQELFDVVSDLANSEIIDPCNSGATTEDIIGAVLDNMEEDCSVDGFEEAMDGVDKIIVDPALKTQCALL